MNPLLVGDIIKTSYDAFKKHWRILWGVLLIVFTINVLFAVAGEFIDEKQVASSIAFAVISIGVSLLLQLGIIRIILNLTAGTTAELEQLFGEARLILRLLGATIVYGLIVLVGFLLLIVPGIIWSIKYGQYKMLIVDKDMGVLEAIKESGRITTGSKTKLFLLGLAFAGLFILALIPALLGLIVLFPMLTIAPALVYRKLLALNTETKSTPQTEENTTEPKPFVPLGEEGKELEATPETHNNSEDQSPPEVKKEEV